MYLHCTRSYELFVWHLNWPSDAISAMSVSVCLVLVHSNVAQCFVCSSMCECSKEAIGHM